MIETSYIFAAVAGGFFLGAFSVAAIEELVAWRRDRKTRDQLRKGL